MSLGFICSDRFCSQTDAVAVCEHTVNAHALRGDLDPLHAVKFLGIVSEPLHGRSGVRMRKDLLRFLQAAACASGHTFST